MHPETSTGESTSRFYDDRATEYFARTVNANLSHLYERFLPLIAKSGRILDVGCGSGRDLWAFKSRGYRPYGIDPSPRLLKLAREHAGVECGVARVQDMTYAGEFDGVWACASLLHLRKSELADSLHRVKAALIVGGVFFASVQSGQGEREITDGRFYAYYHPEEFLQAVVSAGFQVHDLWSTEDSLPNRPLVRWINVLARA
jgi:SAM-dependent methyltransferase